MAINPMQLLSIKGCFDKFSAAHPKFIQFIKAVSAQGLPEGTVLECKVTTPDGKEMQANIKITAQDLELIEKLREISAQ